MSLSPNWPWLFQVNSNIETGVNLGWTASSNTTSFGVAIKYILDSNGSVRAKINNSSQIGLGYQQKVRDAQWPLTILWFLEPLRQTASTFWEVSICLLRIHKNLNFSLGPFWDMSLEVSEKIEIFSLGSQNPQKWISHTQKPIPRHLKIQNPSNGSKVMILVSFTKIRNFLKTLKSRNFWTVWRI